MAFIEASLEELPVLAKLGQSCLATKISAPGPCILGGSATSNDSSEGDYDPTRECFIIELAEHKDDAPNDAGNPLVAPPVVPAGSGPSTSANSGMRQAQLA